jgi:hypothetical protein
MIVAHLWDTGAMNGPIAKLDKIWFLASISELVLQNLVEK